MKAAVTLAIRTPFVVEDIEVDNPIGHEVLIDVKASGLCHSDLHMVNEDFGVPMPAVFGHEVAGVVLAVGPDVQTIVTGDHVVVCLLKFCGLCLECLSGRTFQCLNPGVTRRADGDAPRLTFHGDQIQQAFGISGFAERVLVHENQLAAVNKEIPFPQASLLGCAVATGAGAAINTAGIRVGDTVAVVGTGGVGLNTISGARLAGARRIVAIDIDDTKLAASRAFGATDVINSRRTDMVSAVREITGKGVDHAFEVIGLGVTQQEIIALAAPGGHVYYVGLSKPGTTVSLSTSIVAMTNHHSVQGVSMGSTNLKRDIPLYADLYVQGRLNLDDLVSREIDISEVNEAYAALEAGGVIRSVITSFHG